MHRLKFFSIAALLGVVALFTSSLHANQTAGWGVVVASNAFVAHGTGAAAPVAIGASIVQGDRITTKAGGALVMSRGEDLVTMAENSEIFITDPQPVNATTIQQPVGKVQYHVTKGPAPHFEVDTPLLATIVKGTTFAVDAGSSSSSVTVSEGRVVAKDRRSGNSNSVGAGQTGSVATDHNGVSVGAASSSATASSPSSNETSNGSDSSGSGSSGNSGSSGSSGSGSSGNSGSSGSDGNGGSSGSSGSSGNGNGNGGGNGKGNANGQHDGKGKNG